MLNKSEEINSKDIKLKQILYDNLEMLFSKLGSQNEELEKINLELQGGLSTREEEKVIE